ncbi:MazG nucleotide pyrophosphohydrolase domain-containing protein [Corynebacterium sp. L4756]|uniref:MazG nucleotide pyrophosphohydrolase domain-containing protein n=1 Tax=unclassified Corynebacterium TaxID=2624378 RepID=UPI00374C94C2
MTVLLLDVRWPTMIPMEWVHSLQGPVAFSPEIPVKARWNINSLLSESGTPGEVYVAFDEDAPEVTARIAAGEKVLEVPSRTDAVFKAQQVMERAVALGEWERSHNHQTLLPYLREEAEEFAEAVTTGAGDESIKKELADVFLQVLFHAEIASRRGAFSMDDVAQAFIDKLRSRAPYLFDGTTFVVDMETQDRLWKEGKRAELDN